MDKKFGALSSSVNPQELAKTIEGIMKIAGGALVYFGVASQLDVSTLIGQVSQVVTLGFAVWGALETVYGVLRKVVVNVQARI